MNCFIPIIYTEDSLKINQEIRGVNHKGLAPLLTRILQLHNQFLRITIYLWLMTAQMIA